MAYAGQINGIKITGINHIPKALKLTFLRFVILLFILLPIVLLSSSLFLLLFSFVEILRYPINGIIVNAGIFVNMANPRKIPESKSNGILFFLLIFLLLLFALAVILVDIEEEEEEL